MTSSHRSHSNHLRQFTFVALHTCSALHQASTAHTTSSGTTSSRTLRRITGASKAHTHQGAISSNPVLLRHVFFPSHDGCTASPSQQPWFCSVPYACMYASTQPHSTVYSLYARALEDPGRMHAQRARAAAATAVDSRLNAPLRRDGFSSALALCGGRACSTTTARSMSDVTTCCGHECCTDRTVTGDTVPNRLCIRRTLTVYDTDTRHVQSGIPCMCNTRTNHHNRATPRTV